MAALFALQASKAHAAHFDERRGVMDLSGSALAFGFEAHESLDVFAAFDADGNTVSASDLALLRVGTGIEGTSAIALGGPVAEGALILPAFPSVAYLRGRRVEIRFWQRAHGQQFAAHVVWAASHTEPLADLPFQLTGRGTDDGWNEWTSGPIDFSLGGEIDPAYIYLASNMHDWTQATGDDDPSALTWIDAISVEDLGPASVPSSTCNLSTEAAICGEAGACMLGRCVDATASDGPMFINPTMRSDYLARRSFELAHLEGGRHGAAELPSVRAALSALAQETSSARYQTALSAALARLEDGHLSPPISRYPAQRATGICVHLGEGDMLPEGGQYPLVFATSATSEIARQVEIGDALVSIDGMSVAEYSDAARRYIAYFGDADARAVVTAPMVLNAAATIGSVLRFARPTCAPRTPVQHCAPDEVTFIDIDLGQAEASAWQGSSPGWLADDITCDYRFHRAFAEPAGTQYAFAGSQDEDGIRTLQINGVPSGYSRAGRRWFQAVTDALSSSPERLILDQRTGYGGGIDAVDHLMSYLVGPQDFDRMALITQTAQPIDEPMLRRLQSCASQASTEGGWNDCGNFIDWQLGGGEQTAAAETSRLAILVGFDISGNDYVTKLATYRRTGATRIFGGAPTAGAFGVIWSLPAVGYELSGGSIQVQDTIFRDAYLDRNLEFQTSTGVAPHELVLQRQSDAIRDIDTVVQAATAWLRAE